VKNPMTVPVVIARGPSKGPRIMPYRGATKSPALKVPGMPTIGKVGIMRNAMYKADNDATSESSLTRE
jgi:hypothetical protein